MKNPKVSLFRARRIRIRAPAPLPLELDGEICGTTPVEVSVHPGALRFFF